MSGFYLLVVTLHVLAATVWIGGMLFFVVAAQILRQVPDQGVRAGLFDAIGRRFRTVGWACVGVLLVTGVAQLQMRGWWGWAFWSPSSLFSTGLGVTLAWKLAVVLLVVAIQAVHDFRFGPRAGRATPGSDEARSLRSRAAGLARLNAVLVVLLLYLAVRLSRGG